MTINFAQQLRDAYEGKYRSVATLQAAIARVYGAQAISQSTIKRLLYSQGYRPRGRRPFLQLKRVLPELEIPAQEAEAK